MASGRAEPRLPVAAHAGAALSRRHRSDQCLLPQGLRQGVRPARREAARGGADRAFNGQGELRRWASRARVLDHRLSDGDGRDVFGSDLRRQPQQGGLAADRFPRGDRGSSRERREISRQALPCRPRQHRGHELRGGKMATKLKEVDAVIVGLGWTGGILAKELTEAGLKVVALERGAMRSPEKDFAVPIVRDELRFVVRHDLMQNTARDTLTIRNNPSQEALPMRRLGSFLPGEGVGGAGVHWNGHTWRWTDMEFKVRSMYEERYGKNYIPADMTIQDWGITYAELEPYYEKFEYTAAVSGKAGNINGEIQPGGNPFEAPRAREYPLPPLTPILSSEMFSDAARNAGYHPFPRPSANASQPYTNPDGSKFGACQYCGYCQRFGCEANAKGSPHMTVIPIAMRNPNFELRTHAWVTKVLKDSNGKRVTGVTYTNIRNGEEFEQPATMVLLCAYAINNVHLMLLSGIGTSFFTVAQTGVIYTLSLYVLAATSWCL